MLSYDQRYHVENMKGQGQEIGVVPPDYPDNPPARKGCTDTLVNCFEIGGLIDFEDYGPIDQQEFNDLLDTIALDLYIHDIPTDLLGQWRAGRGAYDTPFYSGGGRGGGNGYGDQQVCLEQGCFTRSEVNYIAQGMWAAAGGFTLEEALNQTSLWNQVSYKSNPSPGELFWTEYGYNWYIEWVQQLEE